jgi:hypothetical protein
VTLNIGTTGNGTPAQWLDGNRRSYQRTVGEGFVEIGGVGDAGYAIAEPDGSVSQVHAAKGRVTVGIIFAFEPLPSQAKAITLVKAAVGRLPS